MNAEPSILSEPRQLAQLLGRRYDVLEHLGTGASAAVFKVADRLFGGEIKAAKVSRLNGAEQEAPRNSPAQEFLLGARFEHPNLVRYFDLDLATEAGHSIVTMEYVPGSPLGPQSSLPPETACRLFLQLLRGLQVLHDFEFIHGDVKPANVLWCTEGSRLQVKLLDYHLTTPANELDPGAARGTLRYLAPEVIAGNGLDFRSDLYSAGALLYEVLSHRALFEGAPQDVLRQHLSAPVRRLEIGTDDSGAVFGFLEQLLAKDPYGRYSSAAEAATHLSEILGLEEPAETQETLLGRIRSAPLVGREGSLRSVMAVLQEREPPGHGHLLLVSGRPGMGKSRFLTECARQAQARGCLVLFLPTPANGEVLARAAESLVLSRAPESGDLREATTFPFLARDEATHLNVDLLARLNQAADKLRNRPSRRLIVVTDNLDDAPAEVLDGLAFLVRALADLSACLFCALGDGMVERPAMRQWINSLGDRVQVCRIVLGELDLSERRRQVATMLPRTTPSAVADDLLSSCGGAPAALHLAAEHLVGSGILPFGERGTPGGAHAAATRAVGAPPTSLEPVLASVEPTVRKTLELLATAADEILLDTLAYAVDTPAPALWEAIHRGPATGFLSFRQTAVGTLCQFQHRAHAEALRQRLTHDETPSLHDQLACALEAQRTGDVSVEGAAARHRLLGQRPSAAVADVLRVLEKRVHGLQPEEQLALALQAVPHAADSDRPALLERGADAAAACGRHERARAVLRLAMASRALPPDARPRLIRKLAAAYACSGTVPRARELLEGALAGNSPLDTTEAAQMRLILAECYWRQSKYEPALANADRVSNEAQALGDDYLQARAHTLTGNIRVRQGKFVRATESLLSALRYGRRCGDPAVQGRVLAELANVAVHRDRLRSALDFSRRATAFFKQTGHLEQAAQAIVFEGNAHQKQHQWDLARSSYQEALSLYERLGSDYGRACVLVNLAQVFNNLGRLEEAIGAAECSQALWTEDPELVCVAALRAGRASLDLGDMKSAEEAALQILETAVREGLELQAEPAHRLLAEVAALRGDVDQAESEFGEAIAIAQRLGNLPLVALSKARLAAVILASGRGALAKRLSEAAEEDARASRSPAILAVASLVQGEVALCTGDLPSAINHLHSARKTLARPWQWCSYAEASLRLGQAYLEMRKSRMAAFYFRAAVDTVERVHAGLQKESNRRIFLEDPRRLELRQAALELHRQVVPTTDG